MSVFRCCAALAFALSFSVQAPPRSAAASAKRAGGDRASAASIARLKLRIQKRTPRSLRRANKKSSSLETPPRQGSTPNAPGRPRGFFGTLVRKLTSQANLAVSLRGLSDGIASVFGLVAATTAMVSEHGSVTAHSVLLTGLGATVAGAASMAASEYSAASYANAEARSQTADQKRAGARAGPTLHISSPHTIGFCSFTSFLAGALVPMTPILLGLKGTPAIASAGALSLGTLVVIGGNLARKTGNPTPWNRLRLAASVSIGVFISWVAGNVIGINQ
jgi:VIT1/CCC1 family predicted Fe2+/Mn2+ transporter